MLPQFRLRIRSDGSEAAFAPDSLEPIIHSLAVAPGLSNVAEFDLQAVAAGQTTLTAEASFEVHLGYPGPTYWDRSAAQPLTITVTP